MGHWLVLCATQLRSGYETVGYSVTLTGVVVRRSMVNAGTFTYLRTHVVSSLCVNALLVKSCFTRAQFSPHNTRRRLCLGLRGEGQRGQFVFAVGAKSLSIGVLDFTACNPLSTGLLRGMG